MIDIKEIKKTCPKAYELLKKWVKEQMKKLQGAFAKDASPEQVFDIPEILITDDVMEGVVMWNFQQLFYFFDAHKIEIEIYKGWKFYITHEEDAEYNNRAACESAAFKSAFTALEKTI